MNRKIGTIVRLQVAIETTMTGLPAPYGHNPQTLLSVPALKITSRGAVGITEQGDVFDSHHMDHPSSRNRKDNDLSLNFTGHYANMQARFGAHMVLGCAAENIIIQCDEILTETHLHNHLHFETQSGERVSLANIIAAPPCAPFSGWALGVANPSAAQIKDALQFLSNGTRGFYAKYNSVSGITLHVGGGVWLG